MPFEARAVTAPGFNSGATTGFARAVGSVGDAITNVQDRELARNLDARQERSLELREQRQEADLAEESRLRQVDADVKEGILSADKQRMQFIDSTTNALNNEYANINKNRELALSTIPGGTTKYDAQGNTVQTTGALKVDEATNNAIGAVNQEYDRRIQLANQETLALQDRQPVDFKAYADNVYRNVLEAGGDVKTASAAREEALAPTNLTDVQKTDLKRAEKNLETDLSRIALGKKTVQEGIGTRKGTTRSKKSYKTGEFLGNAPSKNQFSTVSKLEEKFPNDLFTTSWLGKLEADDMTELVSNAANLYVEVGGRKLYPSTDMILNAALESSDKAGNVTESALKEEKFFRVMERKLKETAKSKQLASGSGSVGGDRNFSTTTYNTNAPEQSRNIAKAQERYNRDVLNITGQGSEAEPSDVKSRFESLFGSRSKVPQKKAERVESTKKEEVKTETRKEAKQPIGKRLQILESKYGDATKGTSKAQTKRDRIQISEIRAELKDIGSLVRDINKTLESKRLQPSRRSQLERELTKLKSRRDILNK